MGKNSAIEWTDHTWNPWRGCLKVSPGCRMCYMYRDQERYGNDPSVVVRASDSTFNQPLHWKDPALVFTCSWSDFFIDQANEWRDEAWDIIRRTPHLTYQILTKRPENIWARLPKNWGIGWPNVWLGTSVETWMYNDRVKELVSIPAAAHFISYEPALDSLHPFRDLEQYADQIDWIISGGESGYKTGKYKPRPASEKWFVEVRDFCIEHGIPFFHKQNGGTKRVAGAWGGRMLRDEVWHHMPDPEDMARRLFKKEMKRGGWILSMNLLDNSKSVWHHPNNPKIKWPDWEAYRYWQTRDEGPFQTPQPF